MGLTDSLSRWFCQTTAGKPVSTCSAICHCALEIEEVTFSANHTVEKDTEGPFPNPEWKRGRAANDQSPICYTRNRTITLTAKLKVTTKPCASESVEIRARATFGGASLEWTSTVTVNPSDAFVVIPSTTSDKPIPDEVACYDPADFAWQYNPGGAGWRGAGNSANVCYATLADPSGTPAYWTLLDISCRAAQGETTEAGVVTKGFNPFTSSTGNGKGLKRKRDGTLLTYYLNALNTPSSGVYTTFDLLNRADGTGRCGAWARFLVSMYQCHGITTPKVFSVVPITGRARVLLVKNCNFVGAGSLPAPFPHEGNSECRKAAGLPGQGTDNPQFVFGDHALVRYGADVYDPSYGVGPIADMKTWENNSIAGLGEGPPWILFSGTGGEPQVFPTACSRGFVEYTVVAGDTLWGIAAKHGIASWDALYQHPYNAAFKVARPNPKLIQPGDKLVIPREMAAIRILRDVP